MKSALIIFICCLSTAAFSQSKKKVQFVGGARSLISHMSMDPGSEDTVSRRKSTGGYALIDLGFKINPNAQTEILGMIRINNDFGGFWGGGVTFDVRQLYVRGVAGKILRYQIGNIDYKLTPYTFYNNDFDLQMNSSGALGVKQDVNDYEAFYTRNNTWRQQGAAIDFGLALPKVVDEIKFNGFITRLNPTNFATILERLYGGGNMIVKQSKYLTVGLNHVSIFDLKETAPGAQAYRNNVSTLTAQSELDKDKWKLRFNGETGFSTSGLVEDTSALSDYFINAAVSFELKDHGFTASIGYMDNGADFRSFGAQSKRINYNNVNTIFDRYTNGQVQRLTSMYDLYNDPTYYNQGISTGIAAYNPALNNVLPFGIATFNRKGIYATINYEDKKKYVNLDATYYRLSEVRGQGTTELKQFDFAKTKLDINLSNILSWKKSQTVNVGWSYQATNRAPSPFGGISLTTQALQIGGEFELVEDLFLIGNYSYFISRGNEFLPVRDVNDEIVNFTQYNINAKEGYYAAGLKFNFSEDVYLSAFYEGNSNNDSEINPYALNQVMVFYVMKF
ncbi:MAG: hypothetical protein AB8B56_02115 [Crocinitomicaceae bacterium]